MIENNDHMGSPKILAKINDIEKFIREVTGENLKDDSIDFGAYPFINIAKDDELSYLNPPDTITNSMAILETIALSAIQASRIPEFVFGGKVKSSQASVKSQMPIFLKHIQHKQLQLNDSFTKLYNMLASIIAKIENKHHDNELTLKWEIEDPFKYSY